MGAIDQTLHVRFGSVNLRRHTRYCESWVRHHVIPMQCLLDRLLRPFLLWLREDGFYMDDFRTNGVLLPMLPSIGKFTGLPVHSGGHPNYNMRIIAELHATRGFCESIRTNSRRREIALRGLRGLQQRTRFAILNQRVGHVDRVVLTGETDGDIDALIDRLFADEAT